MRAIVVGHHGPPEVLKWREVADPIPQAGEAVVRVHAIGVNFADLFQRMGLYPGTPKPPFIPGLEVAGTVERAAVAGAGSPATGERVVALASCGAYAERMAIPARQIYRLPDGIPFAEAAAIPVNYLTAYHAMFAMGNLEAGNRILIHSAAGGVGIAAVQLARARRLTVFGTAGPAKQGFLKQMGVDHPIDYTAADPVAAVRKIAPEGIEMVMDPIGGKSFARSAACLGPTGRLVIYGFSSVVGPSGKRSLWRAARALLETPRFHPLKLMRQNRSVIGVQLGRLASRSGLLQNELAEIFRMYAAGEIKPVIGKSFPLSEAAAAHRYIHRRLNIGKVVLFVD